MALAIGLALALPVAGWAAGFTKPRTAQIAKRTGGAATVDGSRFAAWGGGGGRVAVLDERTGARHLFGLGQKCDRVNPIAGSASHFVVNCGVGSAEGVGKIPYLLDASDGSTRPLDQGDYSLMGRQWLRGSGDDQFGHFVAYTNWHTGETVTEGDDASGEHVPYNLDSPGLDQIAPAARTFVVGGPSALERVGRSIHLVGWANGDRTLQRCAHDCAPLSVEGGLALWSDGPGALYGYAVASGKRFRWRMPEDGVVRGSTARRVYYLKPLRFDPQYFEYRSFRWR